MNLTLISNSIGDTINLGSIIGENLNGGDIIALTGELGSGKTCITRGIARGMGISEEFYITSPTFTLINEYPGRIPLYHLDVYRLSGSKDLEDLGYEEYFYGKGAIVIEWAEKIRDIIPPDSIFIYLKYLGEKKREIEISYEGDNAPRIIKSVNEEVFSRWH
ncbi:MAG: tRNA (adenosine(37)-N6)-threonylcarbamoyltransferase complex ATPase subunit type 1 TsaE [Syntrophaceae bacterium]|nr:tRNA (adenosine(37)-N6)-threonylcarbamoyltransferase complex ATPase subunit type 1 TsaE [Syntrophaceae bacterium]